jgi:glycosyltransferase involved in cell wall biosynthesis
MSEEKLKIVAYVHGYFPNHNAGAEAMLHQILLDLVGRGHEVKVLTANPGAEEYEGIPLYEVHGKDEQEILKWCNIIVTHLDKTRFAMQHGKRFKKPVAHLVHNDKQLSYNKVFENSGDSLAIANSEWIRKTIRRGMPSLVVYPPTIPNRYAVDSTKEYITLINMNEGKGGKMFWQLARILPEYKFLGVRGAYGEQIEYSKNLPNVTIIDNTPNIQEVYGKTRIILMPSSYESWGRVAMEASCSGIPVIATPTPGLQESLDYSGIFVDFDDVAGYVEAIRMLDNDKNYDKYSKLVKKRSKEIYAASEQQLNDLEKRLLNTVFKI